MYTHNTYRVRFPSFRSIPKVNSSAANRTTSPKRILSVLVVQTREIRRARTETSETDRANAKRRLLRFLQQWAQSEEGGSSPRDDEKARKHDGLSSPDRDRLCPPLSLRFSLRYPQRRVGHVLWKLRHTVTCHDHGPDHASRDRQTPTCLQVRSKSAPSERKSRSGAW